MTTIDPTLQKHIDENSIRMDKLNDIFVKNPPVIGSDEYVSLMQEMNHIQKVQTLADQLVSAVSELQDLKELQKDSEFSELALDEIQLLEEQCESYDKALRILLIPRDGLDENGCIVEIRAGTGGEEASLFVGDLLRMYMRYAERRSWKIETLEAHETGVGGYREIIFSLAGDFVYGYMKYEKGVHRVQRIPVTENSGRIHTSAVSVAILPEVDDRNIEIRNEDLRIDVFRSSGPGGQSVNTTDSAVRITHMPTGTVVTCQDEKSQHKNKAKALRVLKARIYEEQEAKRQKEMASERKKQIGSGDRSERIRTYNFPQNRVSDHRINLTIYQLDQIIEGDLDKLFEPLLLATQEDF